MLKVAETMRIGAVNTFLSLGRFLIGPRRAPKLASPHVLNYALFYTASIMSEHGFTYNYSYTTS